MASLINMQQTAAEAKEQTQPKADEGPKYPWGLVINLDETALKKLGVDKLPAAGEEVTLSGKAKVSSVHEHQRQGDEKRCGMTLQITHLKLEGLKDETAAKLYDKTK